MVFAFQVRYKSDCEELFGEILDNRNVVSTVERTSKTETEDVWRALYPEEPYLVDLTGSFSEDISGKTGLLEKYTEYDLVSAVKRQVPFFFQVIEHDYYCFSVMCYDLNGTNILKNNL